MEHQNTRIGEKEYGEATYWADGIADYLIQRYPKKEEFVCASGISPSGQIHFGNFREVITTFAVVQALRDKGKKAKYVYTWDNFDRFRKVPKGIDPTYEEYIGKALSDIPSPTQKNKSYAETYQQEFKEALKEFNITVDEYKDQTKCYQKGVYNQYIIKALQKRKEIADILLSFMSEKGKKNKNIIDSEYRESYYPITIYSKFTGKDATEIQSYDGKTAVRYRCKITKKEETIDITKTHRAKLNWKVDWAMRWKDQNVCFEPAGSDHAAPNSSYDVSAKIAKNIFNIEPPIFTEYGFVGIQGLGTKMSGSKGKNITPKTLLSIYEPTLLLWMYLRRIPTQTFSLAFNTEVYRQYDEMDKVFQKHKKRKLVNLFRKNKDESEKHQKRIVETIKKLHPEKICKKPIPFRQITGFAQIVQWNKERLKELLKAARYTFDEKSIDERLQRAKSWVTQYNKEAVITLQTKPNKEVWQTIDAQNQQYIEKLYEHIKQNTNTIKQLEEYLYNLPKEHHHNEKELKKSQRNLFKHIYQLLIGKESGPRLGAFLWALPKETVTSLLKKPKQ